MANKHGVDVPQTTIRQTFDTTIRQSGARLEHRQTQAALLGHCRSSTDSLELLDYLLDNGVDIKIIAPAIKQASPLTRRLALRHCIVRLSMSQSQADQAVNA